MIKKSLLTLAIAALISTTAMAQMIKMQWSDLRWTSGQETLYSTPVGGEYVVLEGARYFDTGYGWAFSVKMRGKGNYDLIEANPAKVKLPSNSLSIISEANTKWSRQSVDGVDVIVVKNTNNDVVRIYTPLDDGKEMDDNGEQAIRALLCGSFFEGGRTYTGRNGERFRFNADGTCTFNGKSATYRIGKENYVVPQPYLILSDGSIYAYELTVDGINLYNAELNSDVRFFEKGSLYMSLTIDKSKPRWEYLSDMVINLAYANASSKVLRIMRNEVFARKGYVFSDPELNKYFRSCPWYKPGKDNNEVKLNNIETLNIAFLKYQETYRRNIED